MTSFTSNSENPIDANGTGGGLLRRFLGRLLRPMLVVLLCLAGVECAVRAILIPQSKDLARFERVYPQRAAALARGQGLRIAIVGNSAVDAGIDAEIVRSRLDALGLGPVSVETFPVDNSTLEEWHFVVNHFFWKPRLGPDLIVVAFSSGNLPDKKSPEIGRLAYCFSTPSDWPELFAWELTAGSQRLEFLLSTHWASFAFRDRLKSRLLAAVVPDYKNYVRQVNDALIEAGRSRRAGASAAPLSFDAMKRFLHRAALENTPVCFLALPMRAGHYDIPDEAAAILRQGHVPLIDLRKVDGIGPESYVDGIHMTEQGKKAFSPKLAEQLADELRATAIKPRQR